MELIDKFMLMWKHFEIRAYQGLWKVCGNISYENTVHGLQVFGTKINT